jgi:DNA-binding transcriptional regulator YdaS (Cro superfamily)
MNNYMGHVANFYVGCVVCFLYFGIPGTPPEVHHVRTGQGKMRAADYDTLPLCPCHHRDTYPDSLHALGPAGFALRYRFSEIQFLKWVQHKLRKFLPEDWAPPHDPYEVTKNPLININVSVLQSCSIETFVTETITMDKNLSPDAEQARALLRDYCQVQRGRQAAIGRIGGIAQPNMSKLVNGSLAIDLAYALAIEKGTGGALRVEQLCPSAAHLVAHRPMVPSLIERQAA